ncbi:MAG: ech hydrogenase subunit [Campylobacterota bacterium]|nr:ech hydrogenase subunit [Campylobacterota bacterium]
MSFVFTLLAPIFGAFLYGFERVLRARMQQRKGPPLMQPFYDAFKLLQKKTLIVHPMHSLFGVFHFFALWVALGAVFFGLNLLYIVFLHLFALIFLVMGGFSARSVFSNIGANRELLALVAYEPVLILLAIGFYLKTGSFEISEIIKNGEYLSSMFLLFLSLLIIMPIKLKKSPFDVTEAHQEIAGGAEIEYSGVFYEFLYASRFLEYIFVYALVFLFGGDNFWLGAILAIMTFFIINLIDNSTARVKTKDMLFVIYALAIPLAILNIIYLAV